MSNDYVEIGKILAPHGVRGDVRIIPLLEDTNYFFEVSEIIVASLGSMQIENARWNKKFILLKIKNYDSMDAAETLRGKMIVVKKEDMAKLPDGRYYVYDLIGMEVFDLSGVSLGKLTEILSPSSTDVYVVTDSENKTMMFPALKTIVKEIDTVNKKMIVDPPEWDEVK